MINRTVLFSLFTLAHFQVLLFEAQGQSPTVSWLSTFGSDQRDFCGKSDVDAFGNVYSVGAFKKTVDFDPSSTTSNLISNGGSDCFLTKSDPAGNLVWALGFGASSEDFGHSVHVTRDGFLIVLGTYTGTVDFDPGPGNFSLSSGVFGSAFILKLDLEGDFIWAKSIGQFDIVTPWAAGTDMNGNVYVAGDFWGFTDFDPGPAAEFRDPVGESDVFVVKLHGNGDFRWSAQVGSKDFDWCFDLAVTEDGNVCFGGIYDSAATFFSVPQVILNSNGDGDGFLVELDSSGNLYWISTVGGVMYDAVLGLHLDELENLYVTGGFGGTVDFDPGPGDYLLSSNGSSDVFTLKFDQIRELVWAQSLGGEGTDIGYEVFGTQNGQVFSTGFFEDSMLIDNNMISSVGGDDIFIARSSPQGEFQWVNGFGGPQDDRSLSLMISPNGDLIISGHFYGSVDFSPWSTPTIRNSQGDRDGFTYAYGNLVGLEDGFEIERDLIFPNPASNELYLDLQGKQQPYQVWIFDQYGEMVDYFFHEQGTWISTENLVPGLYLIRAEYLGQTVLDQKFVKN